MRRCGACQACCRVKEIPAVPSASWTPCPQQQPAGCACYAERPRGCAAYRCAWLEGWGEEQDRPDRLGLIYELGAGPVGGLELRALEVWPGAARAPRAQRRLAEWVDLRLRVSLLGHGRPSASADLVSSEALGGAS